MNYFHRKFCRSWLWKQLMELYVFPWTVEGISLGENVLELGPGYGVSTDLLLPRCEHLTCIESDCGLVWNLEKRMQFAKTTIMRADASCMQFPDAAFDGAVCFMMLHHVTPTPVQDRLFSEVIRVLKPGGTFAGADSPSSLTLRILHIFDTVCMIDPKTLAARLEAVGFEDVRVNASRYAFRFRARKPRHLFSSVRSSQNALCEYTGHDILLTQVT